MENNIRKKLLVKLLEKYFNSRSFTEGSERAKPALSLSEINTIVKRKEERFQYGGKNPSTNDPEFLEEINAILEKMQEDGFVTLVKNKKDNMLYSKIYLVKEKVDEICSESGYESKEKIEKRLEEILDKYKGEIILDDFIDEQKENLKLHKTVKYSSVKGNVDFERFENILKGVKAVVNQTKEIYMRNLSTDIYKDSKLLETIINPICDIITTYSKADEFKNLESNDDLLRYLNILKNESYIHFKGFGTINFVNGASYELFGMPFAISSEQLSMIKNIEIDNSCIVTIENLTSFNSMDNEMFSIYLGGYHNLARCQFLKKVYRDNPESHYYHFGDIDAGGFYIYRRLKEQTQIPFEPFYMDLDALNNGKEYWKTLTDNDKKRLESIKKQEDMKEFHTTIDFMLNNNCKLEQECFA